MILVETFEWNKKESILEIFPSHPKTIMWSEFPIPRVICSMIVSRLTTTNVVIKYTIKTIFCDSLTIFKSYLAFEKVFLSPPCHVWIIHFDIKSLWKCTVISVTLYRLNDVGLSFTISSRLNIVGLLLLPLPHKTIN